jgi:hypothetical protein
MTEAHWPRELDDERVVRTIQAMEHRFRRRHRSLGDVSFAIVLGIALVATPIVVAPDIIMTIFAGWIGRPG